MFRGKLNKKTLLTEMLQGKDPSGCRSWFLSDQFNDWRRNYKFEPSRSDENCYKLVESFIGYMRTFFPDYEIDKYKGNYNSYYRVHLPNCTLALDTSYSGRREFYIEEIGSNSRFRDDWAADSIMQLLLAVDKEMPKWLKKWQKLLDEAIKENRKNNIGDATIEAMLASGLKGTDVGYIVGRSAKYASVLFRLGGKQQMGVDISYTKFMDQLPLAIEAAKTLNELAKISTNSIQVGMLRRGSYWGNKPVYNWTEPEPEEKE